MKVSHIIRKVAGSIKGDKGAIYLRYPEKVESYLSNPANPVLVSFPRTGSHWLRMIIELYFEHPILPRTFFYFDRDDFILYHTHDDELDFERAKVLYLYRDPVDTIYSQMAYVKEELQDKARVSYWARRYTEHLNKWLINDDFTTRKQVINYEKIRHDPEKELRKVVDFFMADFDGEKLAQIMSRLNHRRVKSKTEHDDKVVNTSSEYDRERRLFRERWSGLVEDIILLTGSELADFF